MPNAQYAEFAGLGHGLLGDNDCLNGLTRAFLDAPGATVDRGCIVDEPGVDYTFDRGDRARSPRRRPGRADESRAVPAARPSPPTRTDPMDARHPLVRALALASLAAASGPALAHGYVEGSRNELCARGLNRDCGAVRYEPQSVEGPDRFPGSGPADGTLAAAGSPAWAPLNEPGAARWTRLPIAAGPNTFHWHFTANHVAGDFRYFITRPDWDPEAVLSRAQFEPEPFCAFDGGFMKPDVDTYHDCEVPARDGYQVILAVWDVGDTAASFHNAIDVDFGADGGEGGDGPFGPGPVAGGPGDGGTASGGDGGANDGGDGDAPDATGRAPVDVGDIEPGTALRAGDRVALRPFAAAGELVGSEIAFEIVDAAAGAVSRWPLDLARHVNAVSAVLVAGVADPATGTVEPAPGRNDVFADPASGIVRVELEYRLAEAPAGPGGDAGTDPGTSPGTGAGPDVDPDGRPRYPDGIGGYTDATEVIGGDGGAYACLVAGWCNASPTHYAPGAGLAWEAAWRLVARGVAAPDAPVPAGAYPAGRGGYVAGTIVTGTDGASYRCRVPGWCNSPSALHYAPGSGLAWAEAWTVP